jgi:5'-3' exonuclease
MEFHLIDGTYELFRYYYAVPGYKDNQGREAGAVRAVLNSMLTLFEEGATHVGIATDHVVESFRNELYDGYKTGDGIEEALLLQFEILEEVLEAAGFRVWPMVEYEADDAIATAAMKADADNRVERVWICSPDKDFGQCVRGDRVIQFDRRRNIILDADAVQEKFGVTPESIPDYLALVGDSADGFPGLKGWGASSAAKVLSVYKHIGAIPASAGDWSVKLRNAEKLAGTLQENFDQAMLFLRLATLVTDVPDLGDVDDMAWSGPQEDFARQCQILKLPDTAKRATDLAKRVMQ